MRRTFPITLLIALGSSACSTSSKPAVPPPPAGYGWVVDRQGLSTFSRSRYDDGLLRHTTRSAETTVYDDGADAPPPPPSLRPGQTVTAAALSRTADAELAEAPR